MGVPAHVGHSSILDGPARLTAPFDRFETRTRTSGDTTTTSYHFVGYVSAYPFWCYPDNIRLRLRWVPGVCLLSYIF